MEFFNHISMAFHIAFEPINIFVCFIGVFVGTLIGVLPGIGPATAISLLLPITFSLSTVQAIIMLAGIYYGAQYGGSTTSILINIPGEASSMITTLDGYQMAKKGRAGPALAISAIGSFIGGTFSIAMLMLVAPPLAAVALQFGPPEYTAFMFFGINMVTYLSSSSISKALIMGAFGLILGSVGTDLVTGVDRYTLGIPELQDGFGIVPVIMGLFGISEVLLNIESLQEQGTIFKTDIKSLLPTKQDWKDSLGPIGRGSVVGFFLGLIPGVGAAISSFISYAIEKKLSKESGKFGTGMIQGVAGPETANNATAGGAFIPLLSLGIPCNVVMAVLMGAFLIHGIAPGPLLMKENPELFWGVVGSMYIGNIMLLVLNLPMIGLWVKILKVPYAVLFPLICLFCLIGGYSLNKNVFDVFTLIFFGIIGYLMKKADYPAAPLVLAFILGPLLEESMRQSLIISRGSFMIFLSRPISAVFVIITMVLIVSPLLLKLFRKWWPGLFAKRNVL